MWPRLVESAENTKLGGWMNNTPALIVNVQRQPGANVVDVVNRITTLLPELQASLPAGIELDGPHRPHHHHPRFGAGCASSS